MTSSQLAVLVATAVLSWLCTRAMRSYARRRALLDVPNHRSMHTTPTPRGGGVAIVTTTLATVAVGVALDWVSPALGVALLGGGSLVAIVGWLDDRHTLGAPLRASVHVLAAVWAVACLRGLPILGLGTWTLAAGWLGSVLAVVAMVWLLNLYNFMDGIDGLAGCEAASVGLLGAVMLHALGLSAAAFTSAAIGVAAAGFLPWNWRPARIFMGDVGSGFLGFAFGVVALAAERERAGTALPYLALLGVFVADATVTLVRRALRGERVYEAHRSHAYQRAVQSGFRPDVVSVAVLALNVYLAVVALRAARDAPRALGWMLAAAAAPFVVYLWIERRHPMQSLPTDSLPGAKA